MAIKIEWVLIFSIIVTIVLSFGLKFADSIYNNGIKKELSFKDTIFTEVDTNGLISFANVKNGEQTNGVLTMHEISFDKINNMKVVANKAIYKRDEIILFGDVKIKQKNGFTFNTQKAVYDTRGKKVISQERYSATFGKNFLTGDHLNYDTKKNIATSSNIHATLYTKER